ncbi:ProQ/FinO family protein [Robbsia andropogonis]|nr:ProQ/FinO family protein [Robbsia andropogonis]
MGFEELAALKQQLSKQSRGKREGNSDTSRNVRATQPEREAPAAAAAHSAEQSRTTEPRAEGGARHAPHDGRKRAPGQAPRPTGSRGPRPEGARADGAPRQGDGARHGPRRNHGAPNRDMTCGEANSSNVTPAESKAGTGQFPARSGAGKRPARDRQPGVGHPTRPTTRPERQVDPVVLTIGQLQKHFPLAFPKNPEPKKPLKLGISKDLAAQAETLSLTEPAILEAIKVWCQGSRYWAAMTNGAARVGLDGQPDGTVTPEQAGHARYLAAAARRAKRQDKQPDATAASADSTGTPVASGGVPPDADAPVGDSADADGATSATSTDVPAAKEGAPEEITATASTTTTEPTAKPADNTNIDTLSVSKPAAH